MIKSKILFFLLLLAVNFSILGQVKYEKPKLSNPSSWSMIIIPDPQSYVKFSRNQGVLDIMTSWVSENFEQLNTEFVLCTGDLVEHNDYLNPNGKDANQNSTEQWTSVRKSFSRLDHKVPYILGTGNHDYGHKSAEYRSTKYDNYFGPEQNHFNKSALREVGPLLNGQSTTANAVYEFVINDKKLLVMVLEFAPREEVVVWAKQVVDQAKYADHQVLLLTHSFLNSKSERFIKEGYKIEDANYGEALFTKLVQPSKNIRLVFSGHIGSPDNFDGHLGFRQDKNAAGKTVTQMAFNAQAMGGGWQGNGGDGWLRILEFLPDGKSVKVKTFSPYFALSPSSQHLAYKTEGNQEFIFSLD